MAYIEKADSFEGQTVALTKLGDKIEGYYLGAKEVAGEYGVSKLHSFKTEQGSVNVWGKTIMNDLLTPDLLGVKCLLAFTGMLQPKKKGRRPAYNFKLKFDPECKIDAPPIAIGDDTSFDVAEIESGSKTKASNK
jgi:hypothetical protein